MESEPIPGWVFLCPLHGMEVETFCNLCLYPENKQHWAKAYLRIEPATPEEIDAHIKQFKERQKRIRNGI